MNFTNPNSLDSILSGLTKLSARLADFTTSKVAEADRHKATAAEADALAGQAQGEAERAERIRMRLNELLD